MYKFLFAVALSLVATVAQADRIRDLTSVQGVRENSLIGYGLVVGLDGTGDQTTQTPFTTQSLNNMLSQLGITVPAGTNMQLKNVAAVMVTASYPAFARQGQTIDVVVSSMGNAKSLRGGTLLMTPLKGVDSQVYALAQGNILVGGAGASAGGSRIRCLPCAITARRRMRAILRLRHMWGTNYPQQEWLQRLPYKCCAALRSKGKGMLLMGWAIC